MSSQIKSSLDTHDRLLADQSCDYATNTSTCTTQSNRSRWISRPMKTCLVLSSSFTLMFTASLAVANLQSSINQEANLGVLSLAVLYGAIVAFSPLATTLVSKLGAKNTLLLAWSIFCVFIVCMFQPTWFTVIPAAALKGAIAAPMWTVQSLYISQAGEDYARLSTASPSPQAMHAVLSRFYGIFFMFYETAQITGNIISSFVLGFEAKTDRNMTVIVEHRVCGIDKCNAIILTASNRTNVEFERPDTSAIYALMTVFLVCSLLGLLLTWFCLPNLRSNPRGKNTATASYSKSNLDEMGDEDEASQSAQQKTRSIPIIDGKDQIHLQLKPRESTNDDSDNRETKLSVDSEPRDTNRQCKDRESIALGNDEASVFSELSSCSRMLVNPRMLLLMPLFMAQAMAIGVLMADYTRDYISCGLGVEWVGYIMTSYGGLCAGFAISMNSLARYVGRVPLIVIATLSDTMTLVTMVIWSPRSPNTDHLAMYLIVPAVSGLAEGIMQSQFLALVAQVFSDNKAPAFATYHTSKALAFTVTFAMSTVICLEYRLYIAIAMYGIGLLGYLVAELHLRRQGSRLKQ